jgi:hypothetical protein
MNDIKSTTNQAEKWKVEGMLCQVGWQRLDKQFPNNYQSDTDYVYISPVCLFMFNEEDESYCHDSVYIGIIFIGKDGKRELVCNTWSNDDRVVKITQDNICNIFWKPIDTPKWHAL